MGGNLGSTATRIVAGAAHSCALLSTGEIKRWGDNARPDAMRQSPA